MQCTIEYFSLIENKRGPKTSDILPFLFDLVESFSNLKNMLTKPFGSGMIHTKGTLWNIAAEIWICRMIGKRAIISANTLIGMDRYEAADA